MGGASRSACPLPLVRGGSVGRSGTIDSENRGRPPKTKSRRNIPPQSAHCHLWVIKPLKWYRAVCVDISVAAHFQRVVLIGQACTVSLQTVGESGGSEGHLARAHTRPSHVCLSFLPHPRSFPCPRARARRDSARAGLKTTTTTTTTTAKRNSSFLLASECPTDTGAAVRTHRTTSLFAPREREDRALSTPPTERRAPGASRARYASSAGAAPPPAHPATRL